MARGDLHGLRALAHKLGARAAGFRSSNGEHKQAEQVRVLLVPVRWRHPDACTRECTRAHPRVRPSCPRSQLRELQHAFQVVAEALLRKGERTDTSAWELERERVAWESRIVELDTVARSTLELVDRRMHELRLFEAHVEQRLQQCEGSAAELHAARDAAQVAAQVAVQQERAARRVLRAEVLAVARDEMRETAARLAQDVQQLASKAASETDALRQVRRARQRAGSSALSPLDTARCRVQELGRRAISIADVDRICLHRCQAVDERLDDLGRDTCAAAQRLACQVADLEGAQSRLSCSAAQQVGAGGSA